MDAGLRATHFISVVMPVCHGELILPELIKRLEPDRVSFCKL
jgi:hypothetical protein